MILMLSGRISKGEHIKLHAVIGANVVGQDTYPSSALCIEGNVGNAAKTTTLRQYADHCRGNW